MRCGAAQRAAEPAEPAQPAGPPAQQPPASQPPPPYVAPRQPAAPGAPAGWPSAPVGSAPPPDEVEPPPVDAPPAYGTQTQAYVPPAGASAGAAPPPAATGGGLPGWALALIIVGVVLLVAIPVVLVVAPFFLIGNMVQDVAPIINEQIDLSRESSVRDGVTSIQSGIEAWAADHKGRYPAPVRVSAAGLVTPDGLSYVDPWPSNPYAGGAMSQGSGAGQFLYVRGPKGASYSLTGYGSDGGALITVP